MKCPACGVVGRIPKNKVNVRLVCSKCLKVFHVTPSGRAVAGEPPQATVTPAKAPREKVDLDFSLGVPPWLSRLTKLVFSPRVLAVVGGLILLAGAYTAVSMLRGESLQERTQKVARAVVIGDLGTLLELTATGTGDEMLKWYTAVQPECNQLKGALRTPTPFVEVLVKREDTSSGTADVIARIHSQEPLSRSGSRVPDPTISTTSANTSIDLSLAFTSEGMAGWRLDGKRTFEAMEKKP
jgi:hypothetical protein